MEIGRHNPPKSWNEISTPAYATLLGSFDHVLNSSMSNFDTSEYYGTTMTKYIYPLFLLMVFLQCILLLNMLIAIMGDIFL